MRAPQRLLVVGATATVVGTSAYPAPGSGGAPSESRGPPTSVEHSTASTLVSFTTERRVVVECTLKNAPTKSCVPKTQLRPSREVVLLKPVPDDRALTKSDRRATTRVLVSSAGPKSSVRLGTGVWNLEWQDTGVSSQFRIDGGEDFSVGLRTVAGACALMDERCQLATDSVSRTVEIPRHHRPPG